jgi:hypothetical protein
VDYEAWRQKVADNPHMIWCLHVSDIAVATLDVNGLLLPDTYERVKRIVAEEIFIRMVIGDLPPEGQP